MASTARKLPMIEDSYRFNDFTLEHVRNRQEGRVTEAMRDLLYDDADFCGCRLCVEDVYAAALNGLPAHYIQNGSLVLRPTAPTDDDLRRAVQDAIDKVRVRPNHEV